MPAVRPSFHLTPCSKFRSHLSVTSGKGRYAEAKGDGTYEGVQTSGAAAGPEVLGALDVVINIKK
jgi:hypothetical protein